MSGTPPDSPEVEEGSPFGGAECHDSSPEPVQQMSVDYDLGNVNEFPFVNVSVEHYEGLKTDANVKVEQDFEVTSDATTISPGVESIETTPDLYLHMNDDEGPDRNTHSIKNNSDEYETIVVKSEPVEPEYQNSQKSSPDNLQYILPNEDKNDMEKLMDGLVDGSTKPNEIPIHQKVEKCEKRCRQHKQTLVLEERESQQSKKKKLAATKERKSGKEKNILNEAKSSLQHLTACSKCQTLSTELSFVTNQMKELVCEVQSKNKEVEFYKRKCKNLEKKFNALKKLKEIKVEADVDFVQIGENLKIEKNRYALCRSNNYSQYTCDLMEIVFGRVALATSVLKGKRSCKAILDPKAVSDIQGHVASKFGVSSSLIRSIIRNKLNTASKAAKHLK